MMKNRRRELRVTSRDDDLMIEAAGLLGVTVSEFVLDRVVADAEKVVDAHRSIRLQPDSYLRFLKSLDGPVKSQQQLLKQIKLSRPFKHAN